MNNTQPIEILDQGKRQSGIQEIHPLYSQVKDLVKEYLQKRKDKQDFSLTLDVLNTVGKSYRGHEFTVRHTQPHGLVVHSESSQNDIPQVLWDAASMVWQGRRLLKRLPQDQED